MTEMHVTEARDRHPRFTKVVISVMVASYLALFINILVSMPGCTK